MRYTVWSRNRRLGETELAFPRIIPQARSGWFHPNADGERLMPVIAAVLPAMRAFLHRHTRDAFGERIVQPFLNNTTLFADLAESFQHLESLDLEIRGTDGIVVPTCHVGIQDTHQLMSVAHLNGDPIADREADRQLLPPNVYGMPPRDTRAADLTLDELLLESDDQWAPKHHTPTPRSRYQIHVLLTTDTATP